MNLIRLYSTKEVCIMYYYIHDTAALKKIVTYKHTYFDLR